MKQTNKQFPPILCASSRCPWVFSSISCLGDSTTRPASLPSHAVLLLQVFLGLPLRRPLDLESDALPIEPPRHPLRDNSKDSARPPTCPSWCCCCSCLQSSGTTRKFTRSPVELLRVQLFSCTYYEHGACHAVGVLRLPG